MLVALGSGLALLMALVISDSSRLVNASFPGFLVWDNGTLVSFHTETWTGSRAGLPLNGGRVLEFDGRPFRGGKDLLAAVAPKPPGTEIEYRVVHRGIEQVFRVPTMRLSPVQYLQTFGNYLFNAAVCFIIAIVALALRLDRPPARALALGLLNLGLLLILAIDYLVAYRFVVACQLFEATLPATVLALTLVFPLERVEWRTRRWLLTGALAFVTTVGGVNAFFFYESPDVARQAWKLANALTAASGIGLLASLVHALLRAESVQQRLQAAVVSAGALVSFFLPALAIFAFSMLGWSFSLTWATALLFFFPLSIFYAVMRYDLLGAERFIRLSVGYALATSAVVLAYALVLVGLEQFASPETSRGPVAAFLFLVAIGITFDPLRQRAQKVVDRGFFRTNVDAGGVLEEAGAQLSTLMDEAEIATCVAELLRTSLKLEWAELARSDAPLPGTVLAEPVLFQGEQLAVLACGPKRSGSPFSSSEREVVRGVADQAALALRSARAIQALREAQETLLRTERFAVIGEFAGAVAHGIRNPLAGIRAAAQIAFEQARDTPLAETLSGVLGESDRLEQRVRNLLDFSRPFEIRAREVDLIELLHNVRDTVAGQAKRQGVELSVEAREVPAQIETDPDFMEEVLLEMAGNALRAMPDGGTLRLAASLENEHLVIRISDTGAGIPEGVQSRIFELFFTTRTEGTGVGLATVRKIVSRLGGSVDLESSGPHGTTFRLEIG
jgi:signal transduction histidine kinase